MGRRVLSSAATVVLCGALLSCQDRVESGLSTCPGDGVVERFALLGSPSLCDNCDPTCYVTHDDPDDSDLATGLIEADGLVYDSAWEGFIIDGVGGAASGTYAWLPSRGSLSDTVTKVHVVRRAVEGVYRVGLAANGVGNNQPSRVAVDREGDAYVASQCDGCQATVAKLAGDVTRCVDLNANRRIDTSTGLDDVRGWWSTSDQDECLLWQVPVGAVGALPRSLAIDTAGRLWVGLAAEMRYVVLDTSDGVELGSVNVDHHPSGGAIESGTLWSVDEDLPSGVQAIDTSATEPDSALVGTFLVAPEGTRLSGVTVDDQGQVFFADRSNGGLVRYRPDSADPLFGVGAWDSADVDWSGTSRGITALLDGPVVVTHPSEDAVTTHDPETLDQREVFDVGTEGGHAPWSVCPDMYGLVWAANAASPNVSVIDQDLGVVATIGTRDNNDARGDFTGYGLMTFAIGTGSFYRTYGTPTHCGAGVRALRTRVAYRLSFPGGGLAVFYGRSAESADALASAPEVELGETAASRGYIEIEEPLTAAGEDPRRPWFQLRIRLERGTKSPVLRELALEEYCQP